MKKNKSPEPSSNNFRNKPFQTLKNFVPQPGPAEKKTVVRQKTVSSQSEHDVELFLQAMAGTNKIDQTQEEVVISSRHKKPQDTVAVTTEDAMLFLQAVGKPGMIFRSKTSDTYSEENKTRSSSGRMRQLKRGTIRITQELDLHGYLKDEALKRLEYFITAAFAQGAKAALVITGKGINSPDGPVLQGAIAAWLRDKGKDLVAEFCAAPRTMGGSGAFVVFLKKKKV
jgi:DNA-nicking Smr family endonuclease